MRTLAIETATGACSVALFEDARLLDVHHTIVGRGHVEMLVPMIARLPDKGRAERILVSRGPGSFTGTRIGLAAARALALAWKAELYGYPMLALIAATARAEAIAQEIDVVASGGHGDVLFQRFGGDGLPLADFSALPLADAARVSRATLVAGDAAPALLGLRDGGEAVAPYPDARFATLLHLELISATATPLYARPPDAKLPG